MEENEPNRGGSPRPEAEITAQQTQIHLRLSWSMAHIVQISVADPDPPDPHVFGPPGSGSGSPPYNVMDPQHWFKYCPQYVYA